MKWNRLQRWMTLTAVLTLATIGVGAPGAAAAEVKTLSTGVSVEERIPHPEYSLKLVFAKRDGKLLADVTVKVMDGTTTVVDTVSSGPWLFVDLPAGDYIVRAEKDGVAQGARCTVPASGQQRIILSWP